MLVAAANPCPCGRGEADPDCSCAPVAVQRYQGRLSGALADRIDILAAVRQPSAAEIGGGPGEPSAEVRERVAAARERQERRLGPGRCNAEMTPAEARECALSAEAGGAAGGALRAPAAQRPRPRPGAAAGADDRRPRRRRDDRRGADGAGAAAAEARPWLSRAPAPTACAAPGCWPCSAPTSRRSRPARVGSRSPELLRLSQRGPGRGGGAEGRRRSCWAGSRRWPSGTSQEELRAAQCWACCRHGDLYPAGLRDAADAPWALIGRGDPGLLDGLEPFGAVTIVGARRATSYGREIARELGRELAAAGMVVVSGLAFGIDACAHRGALDAGRTIAVLGCGPDIAYPAAHRSLWRRICERGPGDLRAPARGRALALDLPRPQPDHGGAGRDDRRGRGRGPLRLADHRRPGGGPRPRPRRRPRPGHLARLGRPQQPARRRRLRGPRRPGRARRDARRRAPQRLDRTGPALDPASPRCSPRSRRARAAATASPPPSASPAPRPPPPSPASSCSATSPARRSALYSRTLLPSPTALAI